MAADEKRRGPVARRRSRAAAPVIAFVTWSLLTSTVGAQLAVSSNDNKVLNVEGVNTVVRIPRPDTVTIIDLGVSPPKVLGEVEAPGSWASPPQSVAVAPDESIALVTSSTKIDPADPARTIPDDRVTVIDLKSTPPAVLTTLRAGQGPSGVSINPAGTLALVANRNEGTVSVFAIAGRQVTAVGKSISGSRPALRHCRSSRPTASGPSSRATAITSCRCSPSTAPLSSTRSAMCR